MIHFVKSVQMQSFSFPYFPVFGLNTDIYSVNTQYISLFSPNAGKYGPEKLRIWTSFTQWYEVKTCTSDAF